MATVKDMLKCPKCRKQMMGKAHPQKFGKEYYAHCCHLYFGVNELVNQWGYDAGDLFPDYPVTHANYKNWLNNPSEILGGLPDKITIMVAPINFFSPTEHDEETGEPYWLSGYERSDAYAMVNRMFLGVPELDDYQDLQRTYYDVWGVGVQ